MEFAGWDAAAALAKALTYAATFGAAGAIFFLAYNAKQLHGFQRRSILRSALRLSAIAALASVARIALLAASLSDGPQGMFDLSMTGMILGAGEGWSLALRLAGLLLCISAIKPGLAWSLMACVGGLLAAASFAAVGHVHVLKPDRLPTAVLVLHLACVAFWLGALRPLLLVAGDGDKAQTAVVTARFGKVALYVVALLIGAGSLLAYQLLGSLAALWSSDYGRMLALKLVFVATLLSAAAVNKLNLTPRLEAGDARAAVILQRSIRFEAIVGALILVTTAAFTSLTGPPT